MVRVLPYGKDPSIYFKSNRDEVFWKKENINLLKDLSSEVKTIFYPGAGFDFETLLFYLDYTMADRIYFVDYGGIENWERIRSQLETYSDILLSSERDFDLDYLGVDSWNKLWHSDSANYGNAEGISFFKEVYIIYKKRPVKFYFVNADAVGTFKFILERNFIIDLVICQDHGLGGLWTSFCGDSILYRIANSMNLLPKFIMVGTGQDAWPKYVQLADDFGVFGLHKSSRSIYKLL